MFSNFRKQPIIPFPIPQLSVYTFIYNYMQLLFCHSLDSHEWEVTWEEALQNAQHSIVDPCTTLGMNQWMFTVSLTKFHPDPTYSENQGNSFSSQMIHFKICGTLY